MQDLYLGIDTSNYKTSIAVIDSSNDTVFAKSEYLEVPEGKRGLRQSEAFFRHSNRLPEYIEEMCSCVRASSIKAVGVSSRPRRVEGSYMPCFISGVNAAREISQVLGIPLHQFSHQEGHAAAVLEDGGEDMYDGSDALLFHLSGGTTEFLRCRMDEAGYDLAIVGGTKDISLGQLIDRTGVAMGLPFPSGSYMDDTVCSYTGKPSHIMSKIRIDDGYFNLSGAETQILRELEKRDAEDYPSVIKEIFDASWDLLMRSTSLLSDRYAISKVFMAGGVASSQYIRRRVLQASSSSPEIRFGKPELSGDNAVGIARLARRISNNK
ncbi:MAG: DNA-binding protein [Mogibacterium sp.]|nr:DNA-binding protein [Mogibacterium sp.]